MKKVGLVTVTYVNNFGSHLQSFALQSVIQSLGFETEIVNSKGIERDINKRRLKYLLSRIYDFDEIGSYFSKIKSRFAMALDVDFKRALQERGKLFNDFANKVYTYSEITYSWNDLKKLCEKEYSSVVIGSDQIWRPANIAGGYYTIEYVADNINKVAYSSSFGISRIIPSQENQAKYFLGRLNYISVREDTGQNIIKNLLGRNVPVVCDPTILLTKEQWSRYIEKYSQVDLREITSTDYILCYFLGENKNSREFAQNLKNEVGFKIVTITLGEARYYKEKKDYYDINLSSIGPLDFINLIKHARYFCTDSFHGCAFSLIFQKDFFAFYKSAQRSKMSVNSRISSMLNWAGATNRIISDDMKFSKEILTPLNYSLIESNLNAKRAFSMEYLTKALTNLKSQNCAITN